MTAARTYEVRYRRDLRGTGLCWRLYAYGPGHWCVGEGRSGTFATEAQAVEAGELWIETGLPPCEQTQERIAERRADQATRGRKAA